MSLVIEPMSTRDWNAVRLIYDESVGEGTDLESESSEWSTWDSEHLPSCRLVARVDDQVAGWAALKPTSRQRAYRGVLDVGIYVARPLRGQGLGKALLLALIGASERAGIWTLQAGIFPDNVASVALHEGCGFRLVGHRERIAQVSGVWKDLLLLERRSAIAGVGTPYPPTLR